MSVWPFVLIVVSLVVQRISRRWPTIVQQFVLPLGVAAIMLANRT